MSEYLEQYEKKEYFLNISDSGVNKQRAEYLNQAYHPKRVLELGAGKHTLTRAWRYLGVEAWGIDFSNTACRFAKDIAIQSPVKTLPFRDKTFDLVTAFDVLEHIPDTEIQQNIKEIHRVTEGLVIANIPLIPLYGPEDMHHTTIRGRFFWETLFQINFEVLRNHRTPPTFDDTEMRNCNSLFFLKPRAKASVLEVRL